MDRRKIGILIVAGISLVYAILGTISILQGLADFFSSGAFLVEIVLLVLTPLYWIVAVGFGRMQKQALPVARIAWATQFLYELIVSLSVGRPFIDLLPLGVLIFLFVIQSDWFPLTPEEVQATQKRSPDSR